MSQKDNIGRCLKYIQVYLEEGDRSVSRLRGFLDEWYGYSKNGPHLTKYGNVRWLNNPDCSNLKVRECLEGMDFISKDAREVLDGKIKKRLIKEHAVPVKVIQEMLKKLRSPSTVELQKFLESYYRVGVLTKEEDQRINNMGFKSCMPNDWSGKELFARYFAANILSG